METLNHHSEYMIEPNRYKAVSVQTKITKLLIDELSHILANDGQIVNQDEYVSGPTFNHLVYL